MLKLFSWVNGVDRRRTKNRGKHLAIKKIAPRVRGSVSTEGFKVAETGHLFSLEGSVAEGDRLDKTRLDRAVVVVVPDEGDGRGLERATVGHLRSEESSHGT